MASNSPRKVVKAKRMLPSASQGSPAFKSVTFSNEIVETSIGGTQRVGKIKQDLLLHFDTPVVANGVLTKLNIRNGGPGTPRSSGNVGISVSCVHDKENKDVQSMKSNVEAVSKDTSCQNLSSNNKNNSNSTKDTSSRSSAVSNTTNNIKSSEDTSSQSLSVSNVNTGNSTKDTSFQNLSINNANNCNISKVRGSVSPRRDKITTTSAIKSVQTTNKSSSGSLNDVPATVRISRGSESSQRKSSEKTDKNEPEDCSFAKPLQPISEDRRTTMERIEIVSQSPFRTPDRKQARRHTLESKIFATPDCYRDVNFGTPRRMLPTLQDESVDLTEEGEDSCSITVAVRVRPFSQRELADSNTRCAVSMSSNETQVTSDNGSVHRFAYDFSFWSHDKNSAEFCDQENVYTRLAQPLLGKAFEGYNTCLFAYGQTGSGKSYSIMGHANEPGIIPRFCEELFSRGDNLASKKKVKVNVEISFFEIYNEKIHDLLASNKDKGAKKAVLKVREHPVLGPYVEGLSTYVVNSFDDVEGWITLGNKNRATAATGMNDKSSRSHSVFTIVLTQTKTESIEGQEHDHSVNSKINLVDLAGSERQSLANTSGERLREGANINKSLLTLGKVISLLSERSVTSKKRKIFIPYRDSVLTWLLKESLGGNSKTAMIAAVSPANHHSEETLSTLRYAQQARSIVNVVRINEDSKAKIIRQLRAEIERLRAEQGGMMNEEALAASMYEIACLKSEMEELSKSWQERLRQAEARKAEELQLLERSGITFKVDNRLPSLVNLNEDPQLSEMLLYVIKDGDTKVGRKIDEFQHDIQLTGALIADVHCTISNRNGVVKITPISDAPAYINGNMITQATIIHHGDRVILGGDHYFRFSHPTEVQNKTDTRGSSEIKDYDYAKQELHRVQEARLQAELEEELEKARKELEKQKDGYENKLKGLETVLNKVEETHRDAQTTINSLRQQNMILKQELLAGQTRQKLEFAGSRKTLDEMLLTKSKIVELLEKETKITAESLEKLRKKRLEFTASTHMANTNGSPVFQQYLLASSPGSRRDLYKIALLLREANKINQALKTNLVFSRADVLTTEGSDTTQIRVTNTRHRMFTLWPVPKFEEKLTQMRDLYQNADDMSVADDAVFNDPEDVWEKEGSVSSPACLHLKNTPRADNLAKAASVMSLRRSSAMFSPRGGQDVEGSMVRACKSLLSSVGNSLTALSFEESVVDKILGVCQRIKDSSSNILDHDTSSSDNATCDKTWSRPVLQLVADVHLLASHITLWSNDYDGLQSVFVRDLLTRSTDQVKVIAHQASSLFQGCEGKLASLMSESAHKLTNAVLSLCEICGELSLAGDSCVHRLESYAKDLNNSQLSSSICQRFLNGCNIFVTRTLEGGLAAIDNYDEKCTRWKESENVILPSDEMPKRLLHVLSCLQALLGKLLQIQKELGHEPSNANDQRPPQFYTTSYKQLQGVVSSVSAIVDSCTLLVESAEPSVLGSTQDGKRLERCTELIQRSLQRLTSALSCSYPLSSFASSLLSPSLTQKLQETQNSSSSTSRETTSSLSSESSQSDDLSTSSSLTVSSGATNESDLTDVTLLSESQLGQIDSAVQEVSMALSLFMEHIRKTRNSGLEREPATPRGRQTLPSSPEKLVVTPAMNTAHLRRLHIKRAIILVDKDSKDL